MKIGENVTTRAKAHPTHRTWAAMRAAGPIMFKTLIDHLGAFWRHLDHLTSAERRSILLVTSTPTLQDAFHVLAIQESWRILFARSLESAIHIAKVQRVTIVVYDRELPDTDWLAGFQTIIDAVPAAVILLSHTANPRLRKSVLNLGGYDIASKSMDTSRIAGLINGAFELAESMDSVVA